MLMKPCAVVVVALVASGLTPYFPQGTTDLRAAVHVAAVQQAEGQRVDLALGDAAPFAGILLDDVALELLRLEVGSLRDEVVALRSALDAQSQALETTTFRAELWKAEAASPAWQRLARYGCAVSLGVAAGAWITR